MAIDPVKITSFTDSHYFLSNFYSCPVLFEGATYPSAEHAYQAAKIANPDHRLAILNARSPGVAKRMGQDVTLRPSWDAMRISVMRTILAAKFNDSGLRARLLATGSAELVEGNNWNDTFWGVCRGKGSNHLGRLLMELRENLRP